MVRVILAAAFLLLSVQPAQAEQNSTEAFFTDTHREIASIFERKSADRQSLHDTGDNMWKWLWE